MNFIEISRHTSGGLQFKAGIGTSVPFLLSFESRRASPKSAIFALKFCKNSFNLNNLCINNKRKLHNLMKMGMNKDYNNKEPEHIFNVQTHLK